MSAESPAAILFDTTGTEKGTTTNTVATSEQSTSSGGYYPSYQDAMPTLEYGESHAAMLDSGGNARTRSSILTDEGSIRDDFAGSSLDITMTGTALFTIGSTNVVGVGTLFLTELSREYLLRRTGDASNLSLRVAAVVDDTHVILEEPYAGTTGTSAPIKSIWQQNIGTGGGITVVSSEVIVAPGTTTGQRTNIYRIVDYPPLIARYYGFVSARVANQELKFGFVDDPAAAVSTALLVFNGTDNTKAILRTSSNNGDIEETTFTLPLASTTAIEHWYRLEVTWESVSIYVDMSLMAEHHLHIPHQYQPLGLILEGENTGVPLSSTTLNAELVACMNLNIVQVGTGAASAPVSTLVGGLDTAGIYHVSHTTNTAPIVGDYGIVVRPTISTAFTVSHGSATTSGTGTSYVVLSSLATNQLTIINNSGQNIEVRRNGTGTAIPVFDGSYWTFRGITNANELSLRRIDTNNVQVVVHYELES